MLILLSPAKSLDYESSISCHDFTAPHFSKEAQDLASKLKKFSVPDLEKLMGISKNLAELNHERFKKFSSEFNYDNSKQALLVFDGDVYKMIGKEDFNEDDFIFAQKNLRILSGFYGLLRPLDLIQPYRLEMGTDLKKTIFEKDLGIKNLYQFWGDKISKQIDLDCSNGRLGCVVNLASEEYFSAVNPKVISKKIINITFKENKGGVYKIVGINAKKARGLMANFIIKNRISKISDLKDFVVGGYRFAKEMSDDLSFVFTKSVSR